MKYGSIRHLDKPVSKVVMGVIPLPQNDLPAAFALLDTYRAGGGNMIDNSYFYGPGFSAVMKAYYEAHGEEALMRLDKGNHHHYGDPVRPMRLTKQDMDEQIKGNLERQGVSYSDLYVMHRDDENIPIGDVVEWLNEHVQAGRIKAFGGSNWKAYRIEQANEYAQKHGLQGFSVSSPNLALAYAQDEMWTGAYAISDKPEERAWYAQSDVAVISWSGGGGGFFAHLDDHADISRVYLNEANIARRTRLEKLAKEMGVTSTSLALAWTLNQPGNVFAIAGPRTVEQVQDNLKAAEIELTPEQLTWLEQG